MYSFGWEPGKERTLKVVWEGSQEKLPQLCRFAGARLNSATDGGDKPLKPSFASAPTWLWIQT